MVLGERPFYKNSTKNRYPLPLETNFSYKLTKTEIAKELLPIIRSNFSTVSDEKDSIKVEGPDTSYHTIDPFLENGLNYLNIPFDEKSMGMFFRKEPIFDICLEDSWSGLFLAKHLARGDNKSPLTILHLDDHTDMMSTLLLQNGVKLYDPILRQSFDPLEPESWISAIKSGAIGIGSFLTPLFILARPVHILHLKAGAGDKRVFNVTPRGKTHHLIKDISFFDIQLEEMAVGFDVPYHSYISTEDAFELLAHIEENNEVVVHIDLDYFINDFNGNPIDKPYYPSASLQQIANNRLLTFFQALENTDINVNRWIVGTSPGFCSGFHWRFLLENLKMLIGQRV
jgi:hypothetical protein